MHREVESRGLDGVLKLYQIYTHCDSYLLAKEPHELSLMRHIASQHSKQPQWGQIIQQVSQEIRDILIRMKDKGIGLKRRIELEDVVYGGGEWKLHSADMFTTGEAEMGTQEAIQNLTQQISSSISLLQ